MASRALKIDPRIAFTPESRPNRERLQNAPAEHADTLLSAYELLQLLHDRSALNLLRGLHGCDDRADQLIAPPHQTPESIRALLNFLRLTKFLASMPANVVDSVAKTVRTGAEREKMHPGMLPLLWRFRNEDSRHAASVGLAFPEGLGTGL